MKQNCIHFFESYANIVETFIRKHEWRKNDAKITIIIECTSNYVVQRDCQGLFKCHILRSGNLALFSNHFFSLVRGKIWTLLENSLVSLEETLWSLTEEKSDGSPEVGQAFLLSIPPTFVRKRRISRNKIWKKMKEQRNILRRSPWYLEFFTLKCIEMQSIFQVVYYAK